MSIIPFTWVYKIIRKYTKPIHPVKAEIWKKRLSYTYAILAWNALGILCFGIYQGKVKNEETGQVGAVAWAQTLKIKGAEVYRFSDFKFHQISDGTESSDKDNESVGK